MPKTTSRAKAEAHEALFLRLAAALDQLTPIAVRHPEAAVAAETRAIAEALLFDSRAFGPSSFSSPNERPEARSNESRERSGLPDALGRDSRGRMGGLPAAAPACAPLLTQLGQARALLEMWEAEHSFWNGQCFVWRLTRGEEPLPIQRLRQRAKPPAEDREDRRRLDGIREMLWARIEARFGEGYDRGYADAREGLPSRKQESTPRRVVEG